MIKDILQATPQELNDSIEALRDYRNRLRSEIVSMSEKLRMSQNNIEKTLNENSELKDIDKIIEKLITFTTKNR